MSLFTTEAANQRQIITAFLTARSDVFHELSELRDEVRLPQGLGINHRARGQ